MIFILLAILAAGCAWRPVTHTYPDGLKIIRVDQLTLDNICSRTADNGERIAHSAGCYDKLTDTIYIRNDSEGAQALPHELAHRQGIKDPAKYGFNWK